MTNKIYEGFKNILRRQRTITFDINPAMEEELHRLAQKTGCETIKDLFNMSITVVDAIAAGNADAAYNCVAEGMAGASKTAPKPKLFLVSAVDKVDKGLS